MLDYTFRDREDQALLAESYPLTLMVPIQGDVVGRWIDDSIPWVVDAEIDEGCRGERCVKRDMSSKQQVLPLLTLAHLDSFFAAFCHCDNALP
jgi:hypothetical protein